MEDMCPFRILCTISNYRLSGQSLVSWYLGITLCQLFEHFKLYLTAWYLFVPQSLVGKFSLQMEDLCLSLKQPEQKIAQN